MNILKTSYKYELIENDRYLLELCSYIHCNPLAANIVNRLDDYPWSSHHVYCGYIKLSWITTEHIELLMHNKSPGNNSYQIFMRNHKEFQQDSAYLKFDANGQIVLQDIVLKKINESR